MLFNPNIPSNYGIRLSRVHNADYHNWPADYAAANTAGNSKYSDNEPLAHLTEAIAYLSVMSDNCQVYNTLNRINSDIAETLSYAMQALDNISTFSPGHRFSFNRATLEELYKWGKECTSNKLFSNKLISVSFDLDSCLHHLPAPLYMLLMTKHMVTLINDSDSDSDNDIICNLAVRCRYAQNAVTTELFDSTGNIVNRLFIYDGFCKIHSNIRIKNNLSRDNQQYSLTPDISDIDHKMPAWQLIALCSGCEITLNEHPRCTSLMLTHQLGSYDNILHAGNIIVL